MMTHHKRDKNGSRRFYMLSYVQGNGDRDGRDFSSFYGTLHERDALMADRSGRRKQDHIRLFTFDRIRDVFR